MAESFAPNDAEGVFEAFELAWQAGAPVSIEDCLRATPLPRAKVLNSLVQVDLEYRLKCNQRARVEDYFARFPELKDDPEHLLELLETERRHRLEFGQAPLPNEYAERFPYLRDHWRGTRFDTAFREAVGKTDGLSSWLPALVDSYRVLGPIQEGGMGEIVRLQDEEFDRALAMKVLKAGLYGDEGAKKRFFREARFTGHLQHPCIPPVLQMGKLPDGRPYFIMKLIQGQSLRELLDQRSWLREKQTYFLGVFDQVCQTVAYAHACGIIHRDLKPDNIMVGQFGEVQVMDWGLAKELDASFEAVAIQTPEGNEPTVLSAGRVASHHGKTGAETELGTPAYMAPEQAHGWLDKIDRRSDVFGLGGILCEILTGKPPLENTEQARNGDLTGAQARLDGSGADAVLIALAKRCLARDAGDRPADAAAVAKAMTSYHELVRERLRQAEVAKAQAEVRALEGAQARAPGAAEVIACRPRRKWNTPPARRH